MDLELVKKLATVRSLLDHGTSTEALAMIISAQRGPDFPAPALKARTTERIRRRSFEDGGFSLGTLCHRGEEEEIELMPDEAYAALVDDTGDWGYVIYSQPGIAHHFVSHVVVAVWYLDMKARIGEACYAPCMHPQYWVKLV